MPRAASLTLSRELKIGCAGAPPADGSVTVAAAQELAGELVQGAGSSRGVVPRSTWAWAWVKVIWFRVRRAMRASGCP